MRRDLMHGAPYLSYSRIMMQSSGGGAVVAEIRTAVSECLLPASLALLQAARIRWAAVRTGLSGWDASIIGRQI